MTSEAPTKYCTSIHMPWNLSAKPKLWFTTSSSAGKKTSKLRVDLFVLADHKPLDSGGTAGCVVAARLAEDASQKILVIEAGPHSENLENVHMAGG
jgi:hypothetical protein